MQPASNNYILNVLSSVRKFVGRVNFTLFGETKVYDNNTIIRMNIIEELSVLTESLPSNELQLTMDNSNGDFDLLTLSNMTSILASKPELKCELGLVYLKAGVETTEWIPMGTFILTEWKNDITNRVITMTANDYFTLFENVYFTPTGSTQLTGLAFDVLNSAGIPYAKMQIDSTLDSIYVNPFPERIDVRSALLNIGIAGQCVVFQDRLGNIVLKRLETMDEGENYLSYPSTQNQLFGYPSIDTYPLLGTAGGMKYIDFNHMYSPPEVSLEKGIYQIVIKIYDGVAGNEKIYVNPDTAGNSGISFEINNPLINSVALADSIADWFFRESKYNAVYRVDWRQNPILECGDQVLIEDSFDFEKQTRIYHQEFLYEGYLQGITESKGGV